MKLKMRSVKLMAVLFATFVFVGNAFSQAQEFNYTDSWSKKGLEIKNQKANGIELVYSINNFSMAEKEIEKELLKTIELPGSFLPNDAGMPDVPGFGKYIAIPQGAEAKLTVLEMRKEVIKNVDLAPAQDIPFASVDEPVKFVKDKKVYAENKPFPETPFKISNKSSIRGVDVVTLGITPFQYNPVTKELTVIRDVKLKIDFVGGNGVFGEERLRSMYFDPILYSNILNSASIPEVDYTKKKTGTGWEYVIVIPDDADFAAWADTIKEFRTLQGIKTGVVTISEIGGNNVETIKNYFVDAYTNWDIAPAAVLIMADYGTGGLGITSKSYPHPYSGTYISDNYYADVVNNDALPDIAFARMTAQNTTHLETMISKFINYEMAPPTNANFYNHPITALGWQTERWFQICSEVVGGYFANVHGKDPVRINAIYSGTPSTTWSTATNTSQVVSYFGPSGQGYIPATPAELGGWSGGSASDVVNAINDGSYLLQHRDHGMETGWGEPDFTNSNISQLTNTGTSLPFIFSINCLTGMFDYSSESFAEKFHRYTYNGQNSGALGLIAASQVSYSFVNDTYVWGMYDYMHPDFMPDEEPVNFNPMPSTMLPGFANVNGKYFLHQSGWPYNTGDKLITYNLFHLHGDAFTTLFSEVPQNLTVNHDGAMLSSLTEFSVQADEGSYIALTVNGEIIGTGVGTGSYESIAIDPQLPGNNVVITVTKQNYYRYSTSIPIIPPSGAYVINDSVAVNDSYANNNALLDYGETVYLSMNAKNVGLEDATNVSISIACEDEFITIVDDSETFGDIIAEGELLIENAFQVTVAENVPDQHTFNFTVTATDGSGIWTSYFSLNANAPVLEMAMNSVDLSGSGVMFESEPVTNAIEGEPYIYNIAVEPLSGNGNGRLDPGETVDLVIHALNTGGANISEGQCFLSSTSQYVTVNTESVTVSNLLAGEYAEMSFSITVDEAVEIGSSVDFSLLLDFGDNYQCNLDLDLKVGLIVEDFETGDFSSYAWQMGGGADWSIDTESYEGSYSAVSGGISHSQTSSLEITLDVTMDDSVSFFYKVSSESGYDYLKFYIDGAEKAEWAGEVGWAFAQYEVTAGSHTLKWEYDKDQSVSNGSDCGWVDFITLPPFSGTLKAKNITITGTEVPAWLSLTDNGDGTAVLNGTPDASAATDNHVVLTASDGSGNVDQEFDIYVSLINIDKVNNTTFILAPNPATDRVNIESDMLVEQVQVFNAFGSLVKSEEVNAKHFTIDISSLEAGIYMVNFKTIEGIKTYKVQVVR